MSNHNPNKKTAVNQNDIYRALAIFIAVFSVMSFFLPMKAFDGKGIFTHVPFMIIGKMFDAPYKQWDFLPMLGSTESFTTRLASYAIYGFAFALIVTFVLSIITVILSAKLSPSSNKTAVMAKLSVYLFSLANAAYSLVITSVTAYVQSTAVTFNVITIVLTAVGAFAYLFLLCEDNGKKAWFYTIQCVLSFIIFAIIMSAFLHKEDVVGAALSAKRFYKIMAFVSLVGFLGCTIIFSACIFYPKKANADFAIPLLFALAQIGFIVLAALIGLAAKIRIREFIVYVSQATTLALLQLFVQCIAILVVKNGAKNQEANEEDYVEAIPYNGAPVANVCVAETAEETKAEEPAEQAPATEETKAEEPAEQAPATEETKAEEPAEETPATEETNAEEPAEETPATEETNAEEPAEETPTTEETSAEEPAEDAFIALLTEEEKAQFTDLYINKSVSMPGIPDYAVGGNNKKFFNKVFIYIGQYRQNIPDELLAKMYDFSLTL